MQTVYFCNVHREDDKVTKWIRKNYQIDSLRNNYEVAMVAARLFNNVDTLTVIYPHLIDFNLPRIKDILARRQAAGMRVWSGAYVITTHGQKMPKLDYCIGVLKECERKMPFQGTYDCLNYYRAIKTIDGLGSFLSAQIVADLKNTPRHQLYEASDWDTFCAPGPGSLRGLNWIYYGSPKGGITTRNFQDHIRSLWSWISVKRRSDIPIMCMQDFQNCLCEFDKFMRVGTETGRSKRKYDG